MKQVIQLGLVLTLSLYSVPPVWALQAKGTPSICVACDTPPAPALTLIKTGNQILTDLLVSDPAAATQQAKPDVACATQAVKTTEGSETTYVEPIIL